MISPSRVCQSGLLPREPVFGTEFEAHEKWKPHFMWRPHSIRVSIGDSGSLDLSSNLGGTKSFCLSFFLLYFLFMFLNNEVCQLILQHNQSDVTWRVLVHSVVKHHRCVCDVWCAITSSPKTIGVLNGFCTMTTSDTTCSLSSSHTLP